MMEFATPAHEACYKKVRQYVTEIFGEQCFAQEDKPGFFITHGSAAINLMVFPWSNDDAVVACRSYVVFGAELKPDLLHFLLKENADFRFGAFGVDDDGDILFEYSIVGSTADKIEVKAAMLAVMSVADSFDDKIVARWGGQRAADRWK